jgi:hypothetical protein
MTSLEVLAPLNKRVEEVKFHDLPVVLTITDSDNATVRLRMNAEGMLQMLVGLVGDLGLMTGRAEKMTNGD